MIPPFYIESGDAITLKIGENMAKIIRGTTPAQDGYRMPAEYEPQERVWMIWPERTDNWRLGAKPAQNAYVAVAEAISRFTPVTMLVSRMQYANCRSRLKEDIRVIELSSNDAWCRDTGPTFLVNERGEKRACDWAFNAWGGLVDGLYFPWDQDDQVAGKICELEGIDRYRLSDFILEGGSFHVDGEGTVLTTQMCLLSKGRNAHLTKEQIERVLCAYLNCETVLWLKEGIDPNETSGHIDDVACFARPGEVVCIDTDDVTHPFYRQAKAAYKELSAMVDAKGRKLKVHKLCLTKAPVYLKDAETIDHSLHAVTRNNGELCIASYLNFLITNGGVIVPQYGDENDETAVRQLQKIFPHHEVVGVPTREIVYGGGNIHCITQQQPR